MGINQDTINYNNSQEGVFKDICNLLAREITDSLSNSENKLWHSHPVWFINGNPIVGYSRRKQGLNLMFWSGQSFDEPKLSNEGSFKAAEIKYNSLEEVNTEELKRWLSKATTIQWNYKDIVKKKGKLDRIS